ncbi:MAG TPA: pteridine reductase [Steroidobacteraceae bacterium]|nr:pteridine reductase [Steroidobacteraceae bacterium]
MNDQSPLAGKSALVTGAARRVGAAIASELHAQGANVLIHHRASAAEARALAASLNAARAGSAALAQVELRDTAELAGLVERTVQAFGRLDILVNNASAFYPTPVGEITEAQWAELVGSNLQAPLFLSQAAAPQLRRAHGLIVNIVDIHALRPLKRHTVYSITKAGLAMLTRALARELGPEIRVNGVAPGPVLWPEDAIEPELKEDIIARTALKRAGSPEDVARAVAFFAKDAPYVTGQILAVDGGRSIGWSASGV